MKGVPPPHNPPLAPITNIHGVNLAVIPVDGEADEVACEPTEERSLFNGKKVKSLTLRWKQFLELLSIQTKLPSFLHKPLNVSQSRYMIFITHRAYSQNIYYGARYNSRGRTVIWFTRNSSGNEIANVNFLRQHRTRKLLRSAPLTNLVK